MSIRRTFVPFVLVATVALASCGGDDSDGGSSAGGEPSITTSATSGTTESTTPSATPDASGGSDVASCDLLTTDEVAAAVGSPVKQGLPSSGPAITGGSFTGCTWQSDDPDNPADTATVMVYPNAAAADSARDDSSQDVPGIGDQAFIGPYASVWVYVGDRSFFAQWYAFSGSDEENLPKSQALAAAVVDAL